MLTAKDRNMIQNFCTKTFNNAGLDTADLSTISKQIRDFARLIQPAESREKDAKPAQSRQQDGKALIHAAPA